ncbi:hypothetical protein WN944_013937 [Citrus x changshan-huyou]|uniref:Uncharacterized protein n=1 Tax=Citrus x changshan-huyou TaxID=2935761 RepID=A0AAP0M4U5_9ROSI
MARKKCVDDTPSTEMQLKRCWRQRSLPLPRRFRKLLCGRKGDGVNGVVAANHMFSEPHSTRYVGELRIMFKSVGNRGGAERNCGPRRDPRELRTLQFFYTMSVWEKVNRNGRLESAPRGVRRQFGTRGKRGTVSTAKTGSLAFKSLLVRMTSPRCRFPRAFAGFLHVELEISCKEPCIPRKRQS